MLLARVDRVDDEPDAGFAVEPAAFFADEPPDFAPPDFVAVEPAAFFADVDVLVPGFAAEEDEEVPADADFEAARGGFLRELTNDVNAFCAPSASTLGMSPTRCAAKSFTCSTWFCTPGVSQMRSAAPLICSYRLRPARAPST